MEPEPVSLPYQRKSGGQDVQQQSASDDSQWRHHGKRLREGGAVNPPRGGAMTQFLNMLLLPISHNYSPVPPITTGCPTFLSIRGTKIHHNDGHRCHSNRYRLCLFVWLLMDRFLALCRSRNNPPLRYKHKHTHTRQQKCRPEKSIYP